MASKVDKVLECGGSLPVDNVQELASKNLKDIPPRYVRPELEFDEISEDDSLQVPVIDMSNLLGDHESAKFHLACKDWGFFQVINHGIAEEVMEDLKHDIQEFFKLPLEAKMAHAQLPNSVEGYGQAFVFSEEQKLDWADVLHLFSQPLHQRNMRFWPTSPPSFRTNLEKYLAGLRKVVLQLLKSMALNLGLDPEKIGSMFEDGTQALRINYYPPCVEANKVVGLTPHSDAAGLTMLLQVNEVQGLQINRNGKWVPIKPIPGAIIVNIGDRIEIMTNGQYKSIEHRAIVNPDKERLSIAAFHGPNLKTNIGPLPDLVKENSPIYKTVSHVDFIRLIATSKLDGKKTLLGHMKFDQ